MMRSSTHIQNKNQKKKEKKKLGIDIFINKNITSSVLSMYFSFNIFNNVDIKIIIEVKEWKRKKAIFCFNHTQPFFIQ